MPFAAAIWIHGDSGAMMAHRVEVFSVSGYNVPMDFLLYLAGGDDPYVLKRFDGLKVETLYNVLIRHWYEDRSFDFEIVSSVEIVIDEPVIEPSLWDIFCT